MSKEEWKRLSDLLEKEADKYYQHIACAPAEMAALDLLHALARVAKGMADEILPTAS